MALRVIISNLPANGGAPITAIQTRRNSSDATIATLSAATAGTYDVASSTITDSVQIRAVNSVGNGAWSDVKALSAGNPELLSNPSFDSAATWAGTDTVSGTPTAFSISGGNLTITNRGASFLDGVFQAVAFTAGTVYNIAVTLDQVLAGSGGVRIKINDTDIAGLNGLTVPGTYTATYTSPSAATRNFIISTSSASTQVRVSAVSLKVA